MQRGAAWALCMGLIVGFIAPPVPPPVADWPDDGLPAFVDGHSLHIDPLLAFAAITLEEPSPAPRRSVRDGSTTSRAPRTPVFHAPRARRSHRRHVDRSI